MFFSKTKVVSLILITLLSVVFLLGGCGQATTDSDEANKGDNEIVDNDEGVSDETVDESSGDSDGKEDNREEVTAEISPTVDGELEVHFIDVGQGDATLLIGSDFTILIDAGRHDRNDVVPYLENQGVTNLDLVIGTHPHADHIGQIDKVLENFDVQEVWMSGDEHSTRTFERVLDAILASDADYHEPRAGETITFGSAILEVVNPDRLTGDFHEGSISLRVVYGDVKFLFTGDAEEQTERAMLARGHDLDAHIFQLGHHGSSTSNIREFLDTVNPEITIYSAGAGNSYGHPHTEVVYRIQNMGIPLYGTDVHGHVIVQTDGKSYSVFTEKEGTVEADDSDKEESVQGAPSNEPSISTCININSATKEQLTEIVHIGEERADQLMNLRPFNSVDELTKINGIGSGRLGDIKEQGLACVK
ncbi:beta-lactamase superfamily II metal-dependent hydrolase [Evansella vedderi]|uniref:Beta-lactamase superfamily II metal-dependent hydrolase n=1 Tax=Evansella vedderi TaxID=38282 RepID=A0ABU0A3I4_9BACI|nr:MBL fold metallo-hydrolase [Evansella vedderi]MDQ0258060.1 beta-lactamase superfamily II metal-dependent hydrolase [Evansella vedderi]